MPSLEIKTNAQTLSVGVIGTGGMGTRHALTCTVPWAARSLRSMILIRSVPAKWLWICGQAPVFDDPERLINDLQVDAVMIVSPDDTHARLTLACLRLANRF